MMKILVTAFCLVLCHRAEAQSLNVYDLNIDNYPVVTAKLIALTKDNTQIPGLTKEMIRVMENGSQKNILDLSCTSTGETNILSTVLTVDVSLSMAGDKLEFARNAARQWIRGIKVPETAALTGFATDAFLYSDFTPDTTQLLAAVNQMVNLPSQTSTDFDAAFLDPLNNFAGSLIVAQNALTDPVIILLTDGVGTAATEEIISRAKAMKARVYPVLLDIEAPDFLKKIAAETGGFHFDRITSQAQLLEVFKVIRSRAVFTDVCTLTWESGGCSIGKTALVTIPDYEIEDAVEYKSPDKDVPEFVFDSKYLLFTENNQEKTITISAKNKSIRIFSITPNSPEFSIVSYPDDPPPVTIDPGQEYRVVVKYSSPEENFKFATFFIEATSCANNEFFAVAGDPGIPNANMRIDIAYPNGGEELLISNKDMIAWSRVAPDKKLLIEFSSNGGKTWSKVKDTVSTSQIPWDTPSKTSDSCLVRVTQFSESSGEKILSFDTDAKAVNDIDWNPEGTYILSALDDGTLKVFHSVFGTELFNTLDEGGAVNSVSWSPDILRFVSGGTDKKVKVWNFLTKKLDGVLGEHNKEVLSVHWNQQNLDLIASCGADSTVKVWNVKTGQLVKDFGGFDDIATCVRFSPDGKYLAASSEDGTIKVWRIQNWLLEKHLTEYNTQLSVPPPYKKISWRKDSKFLTGVTESPEIANVIWDVFNGTRALVHKNHIGPKIAAAAWNPVNDKIISVDNAYGIKLWEAIDGGNDWTASEIENFVHSQQNNCVTWSPDGSRFAVGMDDGSEENNLVVFSVASFPLLQGVSDSLFKLVDPQFTAKDIDFGEVKIGTKNRLVKNDFFEYKIKTPLSIDSVSIESDPANSFDVFYSSPLVLSSLTGHEVAFEFNPQILGNHAARIAVFSSKGKQVYNIRGSSIEPKVLALNLNFGEVLLDSVSRKQEFLVRNNSSLDIPAVIARVNDMSGGAFVLTDSEGNEEDQLEFALAAGEQRKVPIRFRPGKIGKMNSFVNYYFEGDSARSFLSGEGIAPILSAQEILPFDQVKCDESSSTSFMIRNIGKGRLTVFSVSTASAGFQVLSPGMTPIYIGQGDSAEVKVSFQSYVQGESNGQLDIISNSVGLKDSTTSVIMLAKTFKESFEFIPDKIEAIGLDEDKEAELKFKARNTGETPLQWVLPVTSPDGKFEVTEAVPPVTEIGGESEFTVMFKGGKKGESFSYKFYPQASCTNSENFISISASIRSSKPAIFSETEISAETICADTLRFDFEIYNSGEENLLIEDHYVTGPQSALITVTSGTSGLVLSQQSKVFSFVIILQDPGIFDENIFIIKSNAANGTEGLYNIPLYFTKHSTGFSLDRPSVEFVYTGTSDPGTRTFTVTNEGTAPVTWKISSSSPLFQVLSVVPATAPPGQFSVVTIEYTGTVPDEVITAELLISDTCGDVAGIVVKAVPVGAAVAELFIPDIEAKIGEIIRVPVYLKGTSPNFTGTNVTGLKARLNFNATLLHPSGQYDSFATDKENGKGYITFPLPVIPLDNSGKLGEFEFRVMWGNDSLTELKLSDMETTGTDTSPVDIITDNGSVLVTDLCLSGGAARLFDYFGELNMGQLLPNPASETVRFRLSLIETGETSVTLVNTVSAEETLLKRWIATKGDLMMELSLESMRPGAYMLKVATPSLMMTRPLLILK